MTSALGGMPTFSPTAGGGTGGSHGGGTGGNNGETDLMKEEREKLEKEAEKQRLVAKTQYDAGLIDHREYSAQNWILTRSFMLMNATYTTKTLKNG